jgi:hypothetical protein
MRIFFSTMVSLVGLCVSMAYAGSPETEAKSLSSWGKPVPTAQLETQRGGTDSGPLTINANILKAKLYDNAAIDNVTGNNSINGNAFAGASGLPIVIQNSGNNVIIQSGTVLNLTMK